MAGSVDVEALVRRYYDALQRGQPLGPFYSTDGDAGALGPVVKIGSEEGEVFWGSAAVTAAVNRVSATLAHNRLESRGLSARQAGDVGWFCDEVWWSGEADGRPFASLTRWTGVCLRGTHGWKLVQLHVSEGLPRVAAPPNAGDD